MLWSLPQSIRNLLFGTPTSGEGNSSPDLIASVLVHIVALVPSIDIHMDDVASVSRQLSLLFVGFIILSSVRLILERVGRVLKVSSRTLSAAFLLLLLAQLMVCPFFSVDAQLIDSNLHRGPTSYPQLCRSVHRFHPWSYLQKATFLQLSQRIRCLVRCLMVHFLRQPASRRCLHGHELA